MRRRLNKTNRVCSVGNLAGLYHCASKTDGSLGDERVKMAGVCATEILEMQLERGRQLVVFT